MCVCVTVYVCVTVCVLLQCVFVLLCMFVLLCVSAVWPFDHSGPLNHSQGLIPRWKSYFTTFTNIQLKVIKAKRRVLDINCFCKLFIQQGILIVFSLVKLALSNSNSKIWQQIVSKVSMGKYPNRWRLWSPDSKYTIAGVVVDLNPTWVYYLVLKFKTRLYGCLWIVILALYIILGFKPSGVFTQ